MMPGAAMDGCRCCLSFSLYSALHGFAAMMRSVESAFMQHSKRLPGSTSPSTVYDVRALENEFSAEQQILSRPISYLLLMKMKCQNVTLTPVRNLISGKNLIKRNTSGEKRSLACSSGNYLLPFCFSSMRKVEG